jgi:competence protein ComEC
MEGQGVKYLGFFRLSDLAEHRHATRLSVMERSKVAAHMMITAFEKAGLHGDGLALVTALTIGDKYMLDREQLASFTRSGAMHIMAVSGLHVGMISLGLSFLLFFLRGRLRILKSLIIIIALWGFAFLTGMTPSVLRATIMFTFLRAGTIMNRHSAGMNNLLSSAFILTAFRPAVVFEAGFQLSYIAVAFIILFYDPLYRMIRLRHRIPDYLWQMAAVSLVAQAGTLALTVRMFNMFPLFFLLTNIIVIPVSFVVLVMAFMLIITSPVVQVSGMIAAVLGKISELTLRFTAMVSSLEHGVITDIGMTAAETVFLTIAMVFLLASVLRIRKITLKPFMIAASLFLLCGIVRNESESRQEKTIVYNIKGRELKAFQDGRVLHVTTLEGLIPQEVKKHAATRGLKIKIIDPG